jgi:ligand-binding sensor domain-containing protein
MSKNIQFMRLTILFTFLLWFSQRLLSQSSDSLMYFSVENGLSSNTVFRTIEDSHGYIWIMTSRGMSRFDGTKFRSYTTADGLPVNNIFSIGEDSHQRIWLNSVTRVFMYFSIKDNKFYSIPNNTDAPKGGFFNYIYETNNGHLVFQTSTNLIYELDENFKVLSWKKNELRGAVTTKNYPNINADVSFFKQLHHPVSQRPTPDSVLKGFEKFSRAFGRLQFFPCA